MDYLQFTASVINSLAWPAAAIGMIWLLIDPIGRLIPNIELLKYKDMSVSFGKEMKKVSEEAERIHITPKPLELPTPPPRAEDDGPDMLLSAERLAETVPASTIALAWLAVEIELSSAVWRVGSLLNGYPSPSPSKHIDFLVEHGALSSDKAEFVRRMRNISRSAMDVRPLALNANDARDYVAFARSIIEELKSIKRKS